MAEDTSDTPVPEEKSFIFTFSRLPEARKDIDLQLDAIDSRIDKLVKGIEINGISILRHLLELTHDSEDLDKLGKALQRIAPLISKHDDLQKRKNAFDLAADEPNFFMSAFGDFSNELETFITSTSTNQETK